MVLQLTKAIKIIDLLTHFFAVAQIISKVHAIAVFFRKSVHRTNELLKVSQQLGINPLKLKLDVATRWNSTFDMIERILKQKSAVVVALENLKHSVLNLSCEEWTQAADLVAVLEPVKIATEVASQESNVSVSYVVPTWNGLCNNHMRVTDKVGIYQGQTNSE
jgi:hypothetical protein